MSRYRSYDNTPRFDDYREITAKFDSKSTDCGSKVGGPDIKNGDAIGYCRRGGTSHSLCADCWRAWVSEIHAALECEMWGVA